MTTFLSLRPWYVKRPHRRTCVCTYHKVSTREERIRITYESPSIDHTKWGYCADDDTQRIRRSRFSKRAYL
jgi:hypothetical protein